MGGWLFVEERLNKGGEIGLGLAAESEGMIGANTRNGVELGAEGIFLLHHGVLLDGGGARLRLDTSEITLYLAGSPALGDDLGEDFLNSSFVARNKRAHYALGELFFDHDFFDIFREIEQAHGVLDGSLAFADLGGDVFGG